MATPLLVTILMIFVVTRDGYGQHGRFGLGFRRSGWRTWGLALLLPLLVLTVSYGLGWLSGAAALVVPKDAGGLPNLLINLPIDLIIVTISWYWAKKSVFAVICCPGCWDLGRNEPLCFPDFRMPPGICRLTC